MNIRTAATALLALPMLAAAPVPAGTVQSYDGYDSWLIACDNTLACVAKGFDGDNQGAEISIERDAGPAGKLAMQIAADRKFALADIKIDGKPAGLAAPAWQLDASNDETTVTTTDVGAARALVQRLRNGATVTLGGDSAVPLDGFAAAMLRLDERQGRLDGVTALFRHGALPATRVPAAPPLPKIAYHPITAQLAAGEEKRLIAAVRAGQKTVFDKEDCNDTPEEPAAYALDARHALVLIPCLMGAYQGSSLAFIAPRGGGPAHRLSAPAPYLGNDPDRSDVDEFTEAEFEPKTGMLSMAAKGRGLADCGISASWIWSDSAFVLSELALQQSCGGVEPGDWPALFRSTH